MEDLAPKELSLLAASYKYLFKVSYKNDKIRRCCVGSSQCPLNTGSKLKVQKTFRKRPGHLLNVLSPVSSG